MARPLALCPAHGRRCLANAGAPNVVRCCINGIVLERCDHCRGNPVAGGEPDSAGRLIATTYCSRCTSTPHPGWQVYSGRLGSAYPVS